MAGAARVVPWICVEEWKQIYYWIYSEDEQIQRQGLDRVISWRSRCKLPVGVECTAAFVECQLQHARGQARGSDIQSAFALAVVRFVNGITDIHQTGTFAKSVAGLANELGLPQWLVDIRHDATHKILPSIELLKRGCEEALKWLKTNYWEAQIKMLQQNEMTQKQLKTKVEGILSDYIHCQLQSKAKGERKRKAKSRDEILCQLVNIVNQLNEGNTLLIELLSTKYLLHNHGDSSALLECEDGSFQLPCSMVDLWQPLLQHFHVNVTGFMPHLLVDLIKTVSSLPTDSQFTHPTYSWILLLITWASESDCEDQVLGIPLTLNWPSVVRLCLQYPGIHSKTILEHVESCTSETQEIEWIEKAKTLIDIYLGSGPSDKTTIGDQERERSVEDLGRHASSSAWVRCEDSFAWGMCPVGLAPHQTMTSDMFGLAILDEIDTDVDAEEETTERYEYEYEEQETDTANMPKGWTGAELRELQQHIRLF